ncbi:MAG: hypothetical protein WD716_09965 [Fimbriimonadaceae bacterium]
MAGYSGTPLWKKLGMKEGSRWAVVGAPKGFAIEDRPDSAPTLTTIKGLLDGSVVFCTTKKQLDERIEAAIKAMPRDGSVWIAWPKKASSIKTELDFDLVQHAGLGRGLVDNKCCAVDDDWSGLRFVVRVVDRAKWPR